MLIKKKITGLFKACGKSFLIKKRFVCCTKRKHFVSLHHKIKP